MEEILRPLKNLPKRRLTCEGGLFAWPCAIRSADGQMLRPVVPLWVSVDSRRVSAGEPLSPDEAPLYAVLLSLRRFVAEQMDDRACPDRLHVREPALAEYLSAQLQGTGIDVRLEPRLPALDAAVARLTEMADAQAAGPRSLLDSPGVTIDRVAAFAEAAAAFYRRAPWRWLSDVDLIEVESPPPPRGFSCLVVLGAGRSTFGLALYPSRAAYHRFLRASQGEGPQVDVYGLSQVVFDTCDELPLVDALLWQEHDLPVAGERAYPLTMKYLARGQFARPSQRELSFLVGLLHAVAETRESEIDSGRWEKDVVMPDGALRFRLAIPDLLSPPSPQEWIKRGFAPDPRASERVFADMDRYLQEHPPTGAEGLDALHQLYAGRSLDEPLTEPRTPAEKAQDACFRAFDTHGRRRVQLAREALALDPDCGDAYVILAEQAGTLEDETDLYRQGMEAAERQLGPTCFAEDVGHFWEVAATRPYMRARFGLAGSLAAAGQLNEAIEHYRDLLRLNPNDNQGVRYMLLPKLLLAGRDVEAARLLKEADEDSAVWAYARVLLAYRLGDRSPAAERELNAARRLNRHVPELLCSEAPIPLPPYYAQGSFEEACIAAHELRPAYAATAGAQQWLAETRTRRRDERAAKQGKQLGQGRTKNKKRKRS